MSPCVLVCIVLENFSWGVDPLAVIDNPLSSGHSRTLGKTDASLQCLLYFRFGCMVRQVVQHESITPCHHSKATHSNANRGCSQKLATPIRDLRRDRLAGASWDCSWMTLAHSEISLPVLRYRPEVPLEETRCYGATARAPISSNVVSS